MKNQGLAESCVFSEGVYSSLLIRFVDYINSIDDLS